ncbi:MAG: ABC-2 type transport system permease protein [Maribacter sp.]|jgi:ABC-2 type transport system permease protein
MNIKYLVILIVGIILVNFLGNRFFSFWDLTEDNKYSISQPVEELLENLENEIYIRVYVTADFLPADFKLFKKSITEKLNNFHSYSSKVNYIFEDPNKGEKELIQQRGMALSRMGIKPLRVGKDNKGKDVYIFPAVVIEGLDTVVVNLMSNDIPGADETAVIANSIGLLEYNLASGIYQASRQETGVVAFLEGRGELSAGEVSDLDRSLRMKGYAVGRLPIDRVSIIDPKIDVLVIAKPKERYTPKDQFLIDQYVMQGGNVLWLIDRLSADLDSMVAMGRYTPWDYPLEIESMLFKYGFRIKPNLIMDMECTSVKLVDGNIGNAAQMSVYPWYFHPAVRPFSDNPIVKNLDRVNLRFASVIDTIVTKKAKTKKTILLRTSDKSMLKYSPIDLNFEFLREKAEPAMFTEKNLPVAVLAEGEFVSAFEFNATGEMLGLLKERGLEQMKKSVPAKMLVVSDGDIAKNDFDPNTGNIRTLGFDKVSGYTFANKDFLMNAIEYMIDDNGIIQSKNKEVKLNLLDCTRAEKEKNKWRFINIALPLLFLVGFGAVYYYIRRRRFAS